jgi:hypothetical protein
MLRIKNLTACAILTAATAFAAGSYEGTCKTIAGAPATYCTVSVSEFASGQAALLFADQALSQPLSNPLPAGQDGAFLFFAEGGVYEMRLTGGTPDAGRNNIAFAWVPSQNASSWVRNGAPLFPVTSFGATPNNAADDDLPAIQAAVDAAAANQGVVFLPEGVYHVEPSGDCAPCIRLQSGVSIVGSGEGSIVRIRANSGAFETLFAHTSAMPEDVLLAGFTIDQNIEQNLGTVGRASGRHGYLVRFYAGRRIRIEGMRFIHAGVNAVTLNGTDVSDVELLNNYAEYRQDTGVEPYDNTAFYTEGFRITAAYNTVVGKIVAGMPMINGGAVGAIELHGGPAVAIGNEIQNVRVCMSLVSAWGGAADPRTTNAIAALDNRCVGVNEGIRLAAMDNRRLKGVAVAGNQINIAQTRWNLHAAMGIELEWTAAGMNGSFEDVTIANNTIEFESEGNGSPRATALLTNVGIGLAPAGNASRVKVLGNKVAGAPLMGMRVGNLLHPASSYSDIVIAGNTFFGYGQNRLASPYFLLGIRTEGQLRNITIEHNRFETTSNDRLSRPAIVMVAAGAQNATRYEGCVVYENEGAELSVIDAACSTQGRPASLGKTWQAASHGRTSRAR